MSARRTNYPPVETPRPKGSPPQSWTATMGATAAVLPETSPSPAPVAPGATIAPPPPNGEGLTPIATLECGSHVVSVAIFESDARGRSVESKGAGTLPATLALVSDSEARRLAQLVCDIDSRLEDWTSRFPRGPR
jgi:hypothetical protein